MAICIRAIGGVSMALLLLSYLGPNSISEAMTIELRGGAGDCCTTVTTANCVALPGQTCNATHTVCNEVTSGRTCVWQQYWCATMPDGTKVWCWVEPCNEPGCCIVLSCGGSPKQESCP